MNVFKPLQFLAITTCFLQASSCSDKQGTAAQYPFSANVVDINPSISPELPATFEMGVRQFKYLKNLNSLDGDYLIISKGGSLTATDINGSLIQADQFEGSEPPALRYTVNNNIVAPKDYNTLMMLSAYFQFERIFDVLKTVSNISIDEFTQKSGKLRVLYEPSLIKKQSDSKVTVNQKHNAAYISGQKQFALFRRSAIEKVPMGANLQVLGHEFGHALFEQTFFKNTFTKCVIQNPITQNSNPELRFFPGRLEAEYSIHGINEGFADFLSYSITGNADILRASIDYKDAADQRNFLTSTFKFDQIKNSDTEISGECTGTFYCIGTLFAKSLYETMTKTGNLGKDVESRGQFSSLVVTAISSAQDSIKKQSVDVFPMPSYDIAQCKVEKYDKIYDGKVAGAFLAAFVENMPQSLKPTLCERFSENFGLFGFPLAARSVCL